MRKGLQGYRVSGRLEEGIVLTFQNMILLESELMPKALGLVPSMGD